MVKKVIISIDRDLWRAAKILAARQERPARLVVADGLKLMLRRDQLQVGAGPVDEPAAGPADG